MKIRLNYWRKDLTEASGLRWGRERLETGIQSIVMREWSSPEIKDVRLTRASNGADNQVCTTVTYRTKRVRFVSLESFFSPQTVDIRCQSE